MIKDTKAFFIFCFILGLSLQASTYNIGASNFRPENITRTCSEFISKIQDSYTYGWIQNYEVINDRRSNIIPIFYYFKKNSNLRNPVLFFNGGPGYDSHSVYADLEKSNQKFSNGQLDFIFMDQRGTGCSIGQFPVGVDDLTLRRLQSYGSEGIVFDAEALKEKLLGNGMQWKIFGQSFGAMIVYRYLQVSPQSVKAAYAHGNSASISDYERHFNRLSSEISSFGRWAKANPKDSIRLRELQKYLSDPNRCFMQGQIPVCGYEIFSPVIAYLGFRHQWPFISNILRTIVPVTAVNESELTKFVASSVYTFNRYRAIDSNEYVKTGSIFLNLSGRFDWDTSPIDTLVCQQVMPGIAKKNKTTIEKLWPSSCSAPLQYNYVDGLGQILNQKRHIIKPNFVNISKVQSNVLTYRIPLFVYSGSLDSFVPPSSFLSQNAVLKQNVTYKMFPTSGHEGFFTEPQIFRDLAKPF